MRCQSSSCSPTCWFVERRCWWATRSSCRPRCCPSWRTATTSSSRCSSACRRRDPRSSCQNPFVCYEDAVIGPASSSLAASSLATPPPLPPCRCHPCAAAFQCASTEDASRAAPQANYPVALSGIPVIRASVKLGSHASLQANYPVALLREQYRMHPSISTWPSKYFYGGAIRDHAGLQQERCAFDILAGCSKPAAQQARVAHSWCSKSIALGPTRSCGNMCCTISCVYLCAGHEVQATSVRPLAAQLYAQMSTCSNSATARTGW